MVDQVVVAAVDSPPCSLFVGCVGVKGAFARMVVIRRKDCFEGMQQIVGLQSYVLERVIMLIAETFY